MVVLYVNGTKVGTLDENPDVLKQLIESGQLVEFRTESGTELGTFVPQAGTACCWEPGLSREEIDRRVRVSRRSNLNDNLSRLGVK
jgi:hypothetical protein